MRAGGIRLPESRRLLLHFRLAGSTESVFRFQECRAIKAHAGKCSCISGIPAIHGAAGISSILDADILLTALLGTSE
jgi:hypothetical protein